MKAIVSTIVMLTLGAAALWYAVELRESAAEERPKSPGAKKSADKQGEDEDQPALKKFMQKKLKASNQILEGLVTEDFALISKGANRLQTMSKAEQWRVSNDAMYRQYSAQFQRVAGQLKEMGQNKNLEGAALAWMEGTMNCIECHKHVRGMMIANRRPGGSPVPSKPAPLRPSAAK